MDFGHFIKNYFPDYDLESDLNLKYDVLSEEKNINRITSWPPNVFIILYSLLEYTDKYRLIVSPQEHFSWNNDKNKFVEILSNEWLTLISNSFDKRNGISAYILQSTINSVFNKSNYQTCIYKLFDEADFTNSVFYLVLSIDKLFENVNICNYKLENRLELALMMRFLFAKTNKNLADNHTKHGFVTYKTSVPQTGLTINNLTHNLTCIKPTVSPDVIASKLIKKGYNKKSYNILFLPWPENIQSSFFKPSKKNNIDMNPYFGFFDYSPSTKESINISDFLSAILSAIQRVGSIDLIVLPECSISEKEFNRLKKTLFETFKEESPVFLAGVNSLEKEHDSGVGSNSALLAFIGNTGVYDTVEQKKHHRWFLDNNQLRNYNLSASLDPGRKWWENISIGRRRLLTLHTTDGVRLCPLICEDLARQEPVAQAVRAVGPNLVISLLLDGPQLAQRWPGKYSAVLSDDPGSSVLSVTALGMTLRSTGRGDSPSRGVALWSEPNKGSETLYIDDGGLGILIELELQDEKMWTIDGRSETKQVLRKKFHSTVLAEYPNAPAHFLRSKINSELN